MKNLHSELFCEKSGVCGHRGFGLRPQFLLCYAILCLSLVVHRPLSMSENLTKLAHKIDFSKDESEEKGKPTSEGDKEEDDESDSAVQPALWPWDSVWNKLK